MDSRYKPIITHALNLFVNHLGDRLKSAFIKGSVARGDAIWGISDIDFVLIFDSPNEDDTEIKRQIQNEVLQYDGGNALVIQRIADDRISRMDEDTKAYWLYSCFNDVLVLHGRHPSKLLPPPPVGVDLAKRLYKIILEGTNGFLQLHSFDRNQSREFSKRTLNLLSLPFLATGNRLFVAPLEVGELDLPIDILDEIDSVINIYNQAPVLEDATLLKNMWNRSKEYVNKTIES